MAWTQFAAAKLRQFNGNAVDYDTDDIRLALITSAVPPDPAAHDFWNDLQANEVAGTGYTAGGFALANKTVTADGSNAKIDADDITVSQNASGFTNARYAVLYKFNATASAAALLWFEDLGGNKGNVNGDLVLQFAATGIFVYS